MRNDDLRFGAPLLYFIVVAIGSWSGGIAGWMSFIFGGTLYPLIDAMPLSPSGGEDRDNDGRSAKLLLLYAAMLTAVILWIFYLIATRHYENWELIGITLSLGTMTGGIGIPAAHELIHRRSGPLRALGLYLLALVFYMHFRIEHIYGHHRHVATPCDPATARRGESFWCFVVRSIPQQFISAWRIDDRMRRTPSGALKRPNRIYLYQVIQIGILLIVFATTSWTGLAIILGQAATAIVFLEATNYIEHYGLTREWDGVRYEAVAPHHSWNTRSFFTNSLAFNLGLHADHHASPQRAFQNLRHHNSAPQLPAGYLAMLMIATIPPLWRRIMDPRLDAHQLKSPPHMQR